MFKPKAVFSEEVSPQRKLALKMKKPMIKVSTTLNKGTLHKHNNSDVTSKYTNSYIASKIPATTTAKKAKEIPKLLFTKLKYDQDTLLSTTRVRKHKHTLSDHQNIQPSYNFHVSKPLENKLSKQLSSPQKFSDNLSSTESLVKSFTPRKTTEEEKRLL